jgi:hypothetical protein
MGYLICKSCGGRYDLKPGELPGDFEGCSCGGKFDFYDDHGHKRLYRPMNMHKATEINPLMKIIIVLGVSFFLIQIIGSILIGIATALYGWDINSSHQSLLYIQIIFSLFIAFVCYLLIKKD